MTSPNKKAAVEQEWRSVNENIDALLSQLNSDYVGLGDELRGDGQYKEKNFQDELEKFANSEYLRSQKENKGVLEKAEFVKKVVDNYSKHYRHRPTKLSVVKLKVFLDFLCCRKGNTLSSQFMWPEDSNPVLSSSVVRFMRNCSRAFDEMRKKR